jgi:tetratricopeptide (TPR) repeat protein
MRPRRRLSSLALASGLVVALAAPVLAQPKTRVTAAEHFSQGQSAQSEGRFQDAIDAYEQAYALMPHPDTLFNIGVCYEGLEDWAKAAEYFERYLQENPSAGDASTVRSKVRELRAKLDATATPPVRDVPVNSGGPGIIGVAPPVVPPAPKWHIGAAYGLGFGDVPVQRLQAYGGMHIGDRLDLQGVIGLFGKNDHGLGVVGRLKLGKIPPLVPFVRAGLTIGFAKQDDSSVAGTKFPIGLEAGGGLQMGKAGWLELSAAVRLLQNGWSSDSTMADSYVNDSIAFTIDLGFAFDVPVRLPPSFANPRRP